MAALLSVILPTHDRAREVVRAATSVLSQDVDALELVIVDDSSSGDSAEALAHLAAQDPRVRIVETSGSVGPCEARNRGLEMARGELVAFCDDDDAWLPGVGRVLLDFLTAHPDVVAASSWHVVHHVDSGGAAVFRGPLEFDSQQLLWQNFGLMFVVVRRAALSFDVRLDPELPTGEDWDLWLRCSREGPVRTVPHVGYLYTQHGGSRVTRAVEAQVAGRRTFVAKHGSTMTGACRLFHETILAGYEQGRAAMMRGLGPRGGHSVRDRASVGFLLTSSFVASRAGQRRGDPGLQARLMASLLARRRT